MCKTDLYGDGDSCCATVAVVTGEGTAKDQRRELADLLDGLTEADAVDTAAGASADAAYRRKLIHRDERHEVAGATWVAGRSCALHGHSESAVVLHVLSGTLFEEHYLPDANGGYRCETGVLRPGSETYLPSGSFHRIWCVEDAATVHAFGPPPADATSPVPARLAGVLDEAKRRAMASISDGGIGVAAPRRTIVEAVGELAEAWARREEEQTARGAVRLAAETFAELRESGILAAPVPTRLGGWGCSLKETAEAVRLLARQAPATALSLAMPLGNAATARIPDEAVPRDRRAELDEGRRWVAERALAGRILAVANSEPGAGGDLAQTRTIARLDADGVFRLSGRKAFATLGPDADYFLCAGRRVAGDDGRDVVDGFFVARDAAGVTLDDHWDPLGMRATASVGLKLDDAPAEALMGYRGCLEGVSARHWSTVLFAAVFVGLGEGAVAQAVKALGPEGAKSSYVRTSLAECALTLDAAAGLLEAVASDERWPLPAAARERTLRAKTFAARAAVEAATQAAMLCGGRAYRADHPVSRFLHDALAGPLLRPPIAKAMDGIAEQLFR